jgi:small multidrug resistance family-3 protein
VWQVVREDRAWWWAGLGVVALGTYGFIAAVIMFAPRPA